MASISTPASTPISAELPVTRPSWRARLFRDRDFLRRIEFLRSVILFQDLSTHDMGLLAQSLFQRTYRESEVLFEEGEIGRALFIVETGSVAIIKRGKADSPQVLAMCEPGDFFGEMALLEETPRSAAAVAQTDTKVYLLYKTKLDGLLLSHSRAGVPVLRRLAELLSARLRLTSDRLAESSGMVGVNYTISTTAQ